MRPKIILSDKGSQFRSSVWLKKLKEHDVTTRFSPVRHPESKPSERVMRELITDIIFFLSARFL
jgi:transposase InsO family protein